MFDLIKIIITYKKPKRDGFTMSLFGESVIIDRFEAFLKWNHSLKQDLIFVLEIILFVMLAKTAL